MVVVVVVESKVENVLGCGVFAVPVVCTVCISKCGSGTVPNAAACQSQSADYESVSLVSLGWTAVEDIFIPTALCICRRSQKEWTELKAVGTTEH